MAELQEDQELDETQLDETQLDDADESEESDAEESALEEIGDNLEFLRDDNENLNLYQAFQAYHEHRNFEDAVEKFKAAIAYEKKHNKKPITDESGEEISNATLVKCLYWLAESHNKLEQRDKAIKQFKKLAKDFDTHYLGMAAQRRVEKLMAEA